MGAVGDVIAFHPTAPVEVAAIVGHTVHVELSKVPRTTAIDLVALQTVITCNHGHRGIVLGLPECFRRRLGERVLVKETVAAGGCKDKPCCQH